MVHTTGSSKYYPWYYQGMDSTVLVSDTIRIPCTAFVAWRGAILLIRTACVGKKKNDLHYRPVPAPAPAPVPVPVGDTDRGVVCIV